MAYITNYQYYTNNGNVPEDENWEKPECNPPQCLPTGTCTKDILPGVFDEPKK